MQIGIATTDITPPVGIELFGYHRTDSSQGVLDAAVALYDTID